MIKKLLINQEYLINLLINIISPNKFKERASFQVSTYHNVTHCITIKGIRKIFNIFLLIMNRTP